MNKDYYISLITKKLSNELDTSQLKDLSSWLMSSKENTVLMDDFKNVWEKSASYGSGMTLDIDQAFGDFTKKYNIPKAEPGVMKKLAKKRLSLLIIYPLIILLVSLLLLLGYFGGYFSTSKVSNDNMRIMTLQVDEFSSGTLTPESGYIQGKAMGLSGGKRADYEKMFTLIETAKNEENINTSSSYYLPVSTLFEPEEKNYIIEDLFGQGFFELKSVNENQAFLGLGKGLSIGTRDAAFNLQNYIEEEEIIIDVKSGTLVFYDGKNNAYIIKSGERAVFSHSIGKLMADEIPDVNPFRWSQGVLEFNETPLPVVFDRIEKFYGVKIDVIDDSDIDDISYTTTLSMSDDLNDCLDLLASTIDMTIKRRGLRQIEISEVNNTR